MEKKLAIYSRTSTDKQEKGLESQQRALHDYLTYKKIPPDQVLEFSDDGVSGMKRSRPGFDKMMEAVRGGAVHTVLVYSFSRFARSTKHLIDAVDEFRELGVDFVSLTEQVDTSTAVGKFLFTIFAALAQFERDQTVDRVKNGLKNARAKGKILGRRKDPKRDDARILAELKKNPCVAEVAKLLGVSRAMVYRARDGQLHSKDPE